MRNKDKLNLINNYVEIHKCIFQCTQAIKNSFNIEDLKKLTEISKSILELKNLYEKTFLKLKIMDESLILLKSELEIALKNPPTFDIKIYTLEKLTNTKNLLEKDIMSLI